MPTPFVKALMFAKTPAGRRMITEAIRVARSEEGRKLISQARKVATSPEGKRLLVQAKDYLQATNSAAQNERARNWQRLRERFNERGPGSPPAGPGSPPPGPGAGPGSPPDSR